MHRRHFLSLAAGTGAVVALPAPLRALAADCPPADLGPGIVSAPITGAAQDGNDLYLVTRGLQPAVVARFDLSSRTVTAHQTLSTGTGGWAATVSGGKVYVGMYSVADIHEYDPATNTTRRLGRLGSEQFAFDLATAPDGTLYAGTYPGGKLYRIDPAGPTFTDLGQAAAGQTYVRCVAVAPDGVVYAGTGARARLVVLDGTTKSEILPTELHTESFVYDVAADADWIAAGTEPSGKFVLIDRREPASYRIVDTGDRTVDMLQLNDGEVLLTSRTSGSLYRYDIAAATLTKLAAPTPYDETRGVFAVGDQIVGVAGSGSVWSVDRATGRTTITDLQAAGMPAAPEPAQSVSVLGRDAFVGGNFGLQAHDTSTGAGFKVHMGGEAKRAVAVGDQLYLATYPGAFVDLYDPGRREVTRLAAIGGNEDRPRAMVELPGRHALAIGTRAQYGHTGGSLALFDLGTREVVRYDALVPDQAISAVTADDTTAYLGSEIYADGVPPVAKEAQLVAFDLTARQVRWRWTPFAGLDGYTDLLVHGDTLYGLTRSRILFVADLRTRTIVRSYPVDGAVGELVLRRGVVFGATATQVFRLDDTGPSTVVGGLNGYWYNEPQLALDRRTGDLLTLRGNNLVRIDPDGC
ncbi:hypothetical protein [Kribbella shirazensis]|uniref:Outer membrane protein assembly factor BamB n=1 Tax=Kribbella shirazensis TaxID=1105143 RepID=A0A7X5ZZX1_9ACTN|nr:hypothetical protein [Kribbella shirazensis]NIK56358.1 outer membrane protein assembly factor BamB [Kribbella shirazensis]